MTLTPEEIIDDFARDIKYVHPVGAHEKYMEARNKAISQLAKVSRPDRAKIIDVLRENVGKFAGGESTNLIEAIDIPKIADQIIALLGERE